MESKGQVAPWSSRIRHELRAFAGGHFGFLPFAHFRQTPSQLQPGLAFGWRNLQDIKKSICGVLPLAPHSVSQPRNIEAQHLMSSGCLGESICFLPNPLDSRLPLCNSRLISYL